MCILHGHNEGPKQGPPPGPETEAMLYVGEQNSDRFSGPEMRPLFFRFEQCGALPLRVELTVILPGDSRVEVVELRGAHSPGSRPVNRSDQPRRDSDSSPP